MAIDDKKIKDLITKAGQTAGRTATEVGRATVQVLQEASQVTAEVLEQTGKDLVEGLDYLAGRDTWVSPQPAEEQREPYTQRSQPSAEETVPLSVYRELQGQLDTAVSTYTETLKRQQQNATEERKKAITHAKKDAYLDALAILDSMDRAINAAEGISELSTTLESMLVGLRMESDFQLSCLSAKGIKRMETIDNVFDPKFHHAVSEEDSEKPAGTIVRVIQNGYFMDSAVLRYAQVTVAKK